MGQNCNLNKKFDEFFYELEGFGTRAERFYDEFRDMTPRERKRAEQWLRAAFIQGAKMMADDTLEALGDFGAMSAGLDGPKHNDVECFDIARANLEFYVDRVIRDAVANER